MLNTKLQASYSQQEMLDILDQLEALGNAEIANVKDTFEAVQTDSRLGWEPSMRYTTAPDNLEWKLNQLKDALAAVNQQETQICG